MTSVKLADARPNAAPAIEPADGAVQPGASILGLTAWYLMTLGGALAAIDALLALGVSYAG